MNLGFFAALLLARRKLARRDGWTRPELKAHQSAALRELREFAFARSPFYRRLHAGLAGAPLEGLPVVTKADLMEHFDTAVTDRSLHLADALAHMRKPDAAGELHGQYRIAATSGTTGRPGLFAYDWREWRDIVASYARASDWAGVPAGLTKRLRMAVVSSRTPWHQSALVGATVQSRWVPTLRLDATAPLPSIVAALNKFQPQSLVGYASMLNLLAQEQSAGRLSISPLATFAASEVFTAAARKRCEAAWGRKPFDVYAATETAGIASECHEHCGMHLYEDLVIAESVDDAGKAVPAGSYGARLLVTVLFSRTLPLIRYEMSDRVRFSAATCPCGLPFALIDGIEGRQEDSLSVPGAGGVDVIVRPNVFHRALEQAPVAAWQVAQRGAGLLIRLVRSDAPLDEASISVNVLRELAKVGAAPGGVEVQIVEALEKTALGKAPLILAERAPKAAAPDDKAANASPIP